MTRVDDLSQQLSQLETRLAASGDLVAAFDAELGNMGRTMTFTNREVEGMSRSLGAGLRRAFDGLVFDGARLSDVLRGVGQSISGAAYAAAMRPVQGAMGSALAGALNGVMSSILPFADGGAFSQGRVMPFAQGGVVSGPVAFPMRGGTTGLMGEAGPDAILPLSRGADGQLGVRVGGGRAVNVVFNITTPDPGGFQRSQSQIAAQMQRLLAQGQRNA